MLDGVDVLYFGIQLFDCLEHDLDNVLCGMFLALQNNGFDLFGFELVEELVRWGLEICVGGVVKHVPLHQALQVGILQGVGDQITQLIGEVEREVLVQFGESESLVPSESALENQDLDQGVNYLSLMLL